MHGLGKGGEAAGAMLHARRHVPVREEEQRRGRLLHAEEPDLDLVP